MIYPAAESLGGSSVVVLQTALLFMAAAIVPAFTSVAVQAHLARRRLFRMGIAPGALVLVGDAEFIVRDLSRSLVQLEREDGGTMFLPPGRLLDSVTLIARPGEPVPIEIRLSLPSHTNVQLARDIAFRTVTSSVRIARGTASVESLLITPGEVEFIVKASAKTAEERAALLSELRRGLYLWMRAAGIRVRRVS